MATNRTAAALAFGLLAGLGGCTSSGELKLGAADNWGEANRQTFAAQIINPSPEYTEPFAPSSGAQAAQAIERYRTDKVKKPERQTVSSVGRSGGAGASTSPSSGN